MTFSDSICLIDWNKSATVVNQVPLGYDQEIQLTSLPPNAQTSFTFNLIEIATNAGFTPYDTLNDDKKLEISLFIVVSDLNQKNSSHMEIKLVRQAVTDVTGDMRTCCPKESGFTVRHTHVKDLNWIPAAFITTGLMTWVLLAS